MRTLFLNNAKVIHLGDGNAMLLSIDSKVIKFTIGENINKEIDLIDSAERVAKLIEQGSFPPEKNFSIEHVSEKKNKRARKINQLRYVGIRSALDAPPWFQFFDNCLTQFEFVNSNLMYEELLFPLKINGRWRSWDAS
jgi:hypothetical protein